MAEKVIRVYPGIKIFCVKTGRDERDWDKVCPACEFYLGSGQHKDVQPGRFYFLCGIIGSDKEFTSASDVLPPAAKDMTK